MESPIEMPERPGTREISWVPDSVTARSTSPFSLTEQVYAWPGQRWRVVIKLPTMDVVSGQAWEAFFTDLNISEGTFRVGEPLFVRTTEIDFGLPELDGIHVAGSTVKTRQWVENAQVLAKGQKIEIGGRIRIVLEDAFSDSLGKADVRCWPHCRDLPSGVIVAWQHPKGIFRLNSAPEMTWNKSRLREGFQFSADEVILP